jgi:hypothetical protein
MQGIDPGINRADTIALLRPFLEVIRHIAETSELVALIVSCLGPLTWCDYADRQHPEAVNRMVRMGLADDLTNEDFMAVLK